MIGSICVCGAGTMGRGIARLAAASGLPTLLYDKQATVLESAKAEIEKGLQSMVDKNKITQQEFQSTSTRLRYSTQIGDCVADLVIEAIVEVLEQKEELFRALEQINPASTYYASNTSSLSVTKIAACLSHPQKMAGMHFFNPPQVMKLVEIVRTAYTDQQTLEVISGLAKQMGKSPVLCLDAPGFIVNHVARPFYLEALHLLEIGISDCASTDRLMEAAGFKMGPFRLMDLIGNDINYAVSCSLYESFGRPPRLKPSRIQKEKVDALMLGQKTQKGYYDYSS